MLVSLVHIYWEAIFGTEYKMLATSVASWDWILGGGLVKDGKARNQLLTGSGNMSISHPCLLVSGPVLILLHPWLGYQDTRLSDSLSTSLSLMPVHGGWRQPTEKWQWGAIQRRWGGGVLACYINNSSLSFIYADGSLNSRSMHGKFLVCEIMCILLQYS